MKKYFSGKTIWITGASSGIGEGLAHELARHDTTLILSSRRLEALEAVRNSLPESSRSRVHLLPFDLTAAETLEDVTNRALAFSGRIDVVILNGGISQRSLVRNTLLSVDRELMEVDYFANIAITKYLLPHFTSRDAGHIVVMSSVLGYIGTPFRSGYAAAKHALHGYYDSLRAELWRKTKGIKVTLICPGWVKTSITMNAVAGDGSRLNQMDPSTAHGMDPGVFAVKMLKSVAAGKTTALIGGLKEVSAVWVQRFLPGLFVRIVRNVSVR